MNPEAKISIRSAHLSDLREVKRISHETFVETYGAFNSQENVDHYLDDNFSEASLTQEIANPDSFFYLLYSGEKLAGYLKVNISSAQTEELPDALEIERIYVLAEWQGLKFGKLLLDKAIEKAKKLGKTCVWLGVWEDNEKAIGFYARHGFVQFGEHNFRFGDEDQLDYLLRLALPD